MPRDAHGHFLPGNTDASAGGKARAARLDAQRRKEIATMGGKAGFQALVDKWFGGDVAAAKKYIGAYGAWAADRIAFDESPIAKPLSYRRPTPPWEPRIAPEPPPEPPWSTPAALLNPDDGDPDLPF